MEERGIHYRTGSKISHSGVEMLPDGKEIPYIVIEKIEYKEVEEVAGRKENGVWVATFAPNPYTKLPMILNATNKKRIAKLAGTDMINLVKNLAVRLCSEECKDAQDGGLTRGLRISKMPAILPQPPKKQELTPAHPDWQKCVDFLATGGGTIPQLEGRYAISDAVKTTLSESIPKPAEE